MNATVSEPTTSAAKVFVVDDHPIVCDGLVRCLDSQPDLHVCGEASSIREALQSLELVEPDIVVVDVSLRDGSGIELIKQAKARFSHLRFLVYSMFEDSIYAERALRAGALGYVNKQVSSERLLSAIREVLQGKMCVHPEIADRVMRRAIHTEDQPVMASPLQTLSDREIEVFRMLGEGMKTRRIAERLHISARTIETHRQNIKRKLNIRDSSELMRRAVEWTLSSSNVTPEANY